MLNQIVVVGRLTKNPEIKELENGKKVAEVTLAVPRSYKNVDGEYDTDFIDVVLYSGIAENTTEYCMKGDLIGIKGNITRLSGEEMKLVAERVTFLSSKKED